MGLVLEPMQLEDIPEVMEVDRQCFATPWSAIAYRSEVGNSASYYLVARIEGRLVGFGGAWLITDEAHVTTLGVDPAFRRRKIGERILAAILVEARSRRVRRASLEVRESNVSAIHLYEKYGFVAVARRRRYYSNNDEDGIVMWIEDMTRPTYERLLDERVAALSREIDARPGD